MSVGGRRVRDEESALWQRIARDVTPLPRGALASEETVVEQEAPPPLPKKRKPRVAKSAGGEPGAAPHRRRSPTSTR